MFGYISRRSNDCSKAKRCKCVAYSHWVDMIWTTNLMFEILEEDVELEWNRPTLVNDIKLLHYVNHE